MSDLYKKISQQVKESEIEREKEHQRKMKLGKEALKDYRYKTQYLIDPRPSSLFRNLKYDLLKFGIILTFAFYMFNKIYKESQGNKIKDDLYNLNKDSDKDKEVKEVDKYVRFDKFDFINEDKFRRERAIARKHRNLEQHTKDL